MADGSDGPSPELLAAIDRRAAAPLHAQVERALRGHIRSGRLRPGDRLPSTRALAADLGVARGVVAEAYAQLRAEGRLVANRGAGTRVAARASDSGPARPAPRSSGGGESHLAAGPQPAIRFDFRLGIPDLALFPRRAWLAANRRALAELPDGDLGYGDPAGLAALRGELAAYLGRVRAADARADSIIVTAGTVQGLALVCSVLRERGVRRIAVEQPGWAAQRAAVLGAGLEPVGLPVDGCGARVELLAELDVGAVMLTPAHQFPVGAVLDPERRRLLAAWAANGDALIVEDDYDAEYRYDRSAPGCLQGLAPEHTVYAGSTSKTLAPALRLGWLVAPPALAGPLARAKLDADRCAPALTQAAFARLLAAGELDRHLRRTRPVYRDRRAALLDALAGHLPELTPTSADAGLHAVALLPPGLDERAVVAAAAARGVALTGVRQDGGAGDPGLVLGYASLPAERIRAGIAELAHAVAAARRTR
ncbi:MAG: PLP-dependent aminotransferase family protein [Solirubrobacterales bacterium]|nr:PLP-dependent aminotransferase family protein [Solirubrobacterales bacterium]